MTQPPILPPRIGKPQRPKAFPPPEFPPRKPKLFAKTPPAIFPVVLGLLGLGLAWILLLLGCCGICWGSFFRLFFGACSWVFSRCRDCPRLGQSLFAAPKSNQKSLLNTHGGTPFAPLALRSDSRRESEFLWGSALRFARACLLRLGCVLFRLPAACFGLWFFYFLGWPLVLWRIALGSVLCASLSYFDDERSPHPI